MSILRILERIYRIITAPHSNWLSVCNHYLQITHKLHTSCKEFHLSSYCGRRWNYHYGGFRAVLTELDITNKLIFFSFSFQAQPLDIQLEDHLQLQHLQALRRAFQHHQPDDLEPGRKGLLTLTEFTNVVRQVLGTKTFDAQLENLFTKVCSPS